MVLLGFLESVTAALGEGDRPSQRVEDDRAAQASAPARPQQLTHGDKQSCAVISEYYTQGNNKQIFTKNCPMLTSQSQSFYQVLWLQNVCCKKIMNIVMNSYLSIIFTNKYSN